MSRHQIDRVLKATFFDTGDVCLFCTLRFGRSSQRKKSLAITQSRSYRASTARSSVAAPQKAEKEAEEVPRSSAWPAFVPNARPDQPVPQSHRATSSDSRPSSGAPLLDVKLDQSDGNGKGPTIRWAAPAAQLSDFKRSRYGPRFGDGRKASTPPDEQFGERWRKRSSKGQKDADASMPQARTDHSTFRSSGSQSQWQPFVPNTGPPRTQEPLPTTVSGLTQTGRSDRFGRNLSAKLAAENDEWEQQRANKMDKGGVGIRVRRPISHNYLLGPADEHFPHYRTPKAPPDHRHKHLTPLIASRPQRRQRQESAFQYSPLPEPVADIQPVTDRVSDFGKVSDIYPTSELRSTSDFKARSDFRPLAKPPVTELPERQEERLLEQTWKPDRVRGRFQPDPPELDDTSQETRDPRYAGSKKWQRDLVDLEEDTERRKTRKPKKQSQRVEQPVKRQVFLPEFISVEDLATAVRVRFSEFVSRMVDMGFDRPLPEHVLDQELAGLIAGEFNFDPVFPQRDKDLVARPAPENKTDLPVRPPIVTIMGHVDHGKTTILDWLRKSSVVESEHGGITQHIGAFSVKMPGGKQITFLDTPGHEAFLDMRRRGANVTDIVILVVAADDSVKPQTIEAIKHANEAKVPIIVAINKVDKEDANIDRVKQDLARHGVSVEDFGGDVQAIPVSGKFGRGMKELEEATVTLSEMIDHRAEVDGSVEGWVIESKTTPAGRVATVLIRRGTMRPGDLIVAGTTWARVRTLRNDNGFLIDEAPPGTPVQIDGWRADDPLAGWEVLQAESEDHAKQVVEQRQNRAEIEKLAKDSAAINATRIEQAQARESVLAWKAEQTWGAYHPSRHPKENHGWKDTAGTTGFKEILFVVKADVSGSVEAVVNSISALGNNEIAVNVIKSGVGEVNESDVQHLAMTQQSGYVISFNQSVDAHVSNIASAAGVEILDQNIIYRLTDAVKDKLEAALPPIITQKLLGEAEVRQVFEVTEKRKKVKIAGCKIENGIIQRSKSVRVLRGGEQIHSGTLCSLKNVKKDVTEMRKGSECGMAFVDWDTFEEGDKVQCYEEVSTPRKL